MNDLQRNASWYLSRKGKLTASEIYILLANHREDMTEDELEQFKKDNPKSRVRTKEIPFSQGTFSYLDGKIAEQFMPDNAFLEYMEDCSPRSRAMDWGTLMEDSARSRYQEETGNEVLDAPFVPLKGFEKFAGGSPDGIIRSGGIIEIKCPFSPAIHLKHFLYETADDLKEDNLQYYCQIQYNMICVEREFGVDVTFGDFISYDPRISKSKQLKVLHIPKDEEVQKQLLERTELAVEYFKEKINKISNAKVIV
jgi:phage-related exonuclease|nr:MAG TPA: Exonuclease [Caudoviricetes sp.]